MITVRTLTGKTLHFDEDAATTALELKELVFDREGIPPDQQRLIVAGRQLSGTDVIPANVRRGDVVVHLVLRLRCDCTPLASCPSDVCLVRVSKPGAGGDGKDDSDADGEPPEMTLAELRCNQLLPPSPTYPLF
jgi:ubiquitin-large subunit ribosomal protein L40e